MTQIDFYINPENALQYAARLVRKAYQQNRQMVVVLDADEMKDFDALLWTISDVDFLPHVNLEDPLCAVTPIVLMPSATTYDEAIKFPHYDLLINLSAQFPPQFAAFLRLCEIVRPAHLEEGRARYAFYKKRGYALSNTNAAESQKP